MWATLDSRTDEAEPARPYQQECLEIVKKQNTIVSIPAGGGKTLVAVLAIDHFLVATGRKGMFAVPTRVLVVQQAQYCREKSRREPRPRVAELAGKEMDTWTSQKWAACMRDHDVFVGTPEVFRRALVDQAFIKPEVFAIIVFDECHNATGNSPMAAIMRDAVWPIADSPECPRILGLTASFVNGSLTNMEAKRQKLETLLNASIFCPKVPSWALAGGATAGNGTNDGGMATFRTVEFRNVVPLDAVDFVNRKLGQLTEKFEQAFGVEIKGANKLVRQTAHVFEELGMSAFLFALRECVIPQLEVHAVELTKLGPDQAALAAVVREGLPKVRMHLKQAADELSRADQLTRAPLTSEKAQELLSLLERLFAAAHSDPDFRGIVFVQQIALTFPLTHLVNERFKAIGPARVRGGPLTGVNSMTEAQRSAYMEKFRTGELNLLVCTQAVEEGVDVSACSFVIRFSRFETTKSHIQGSGRARRRNAAIYYFENNPSLEEAGARRLTDVAKDASLALTDAERTERRVEEMRSLPGVYPFRPLGEDGPELNFFNCLQVVYEYCCKTMRQSIEPDKLFTYETEVIRMYPREERKTLKSVQIPSPQGFIPISVEDVNAFWRDVKLEDILPPERCQRLTKDEKERRRMLYVTAIRMHELGLLDRNNQPSGRALSETAHACPAFVMEPGIKIKPSYARDALACGSPPARPAQVPAGGPGPNAGQRPTGPQPSTIVSLRTSQPGQSAGQEHGGTRSPSEAAAGAAFPRPDLLRPPSQVPPADTGDDESLNYKGKLNEWAQKTWRLPDSQLLRYETTSSPAGFTSTVLVLQEQPPARITGELKSKKRLAEQSAAKVALARLK